MMRTLDSSPASSAKQRFRRVFSKMAMALAQPAMQLPITGASYGACVPNVPHPLQPRPPTGALSILPRRSRLQCHRAVQVPVRHRGQLPDRLLCCLLLHGLRRRRARVEPGPDPVRRHGHRPEYAFSPRCLSLRLRRASALSGRCPGSPPLSPWLKSPLRFAPQAPARSRAPRTASRGRARPSCPTAARAEFTRRR